MKETIKHLAAGALVAIGLVTIGIGRAEAAQITATLTADNHYGLFTGNEDGSILNFIGRNEFGPGGNPGSFNWSLPETWTFNVRSNDYLYVIVWDDSAVDESWIGEFTFDNGNQLLSLAQDWEYIISNSPNPGDFGNVPSNDQLNSEIANATWLAAQSRGDNGIAPWGFIPGISADADFLNTTTPSNNKYTIFRTTVPVETPEPGVTFALLAVGALGGTKMLKRKSRG